MISHGQTRAFRVEYLWRCRASHAFGVAEKFVAVALASDCAIMHRFFGRIN